MPGRTDEEVARYWYRRHLTDQKLFGGQLNRILSDAASQAGKAVNASLGDDSISALVRRAQYMSARAEIERINAELWGQVDAKTIRGIEQASARAVSLWDEVNARLGGTIDTRTMEQTFRASAHNAVEHVRSRYINDIDLAPTVYKNQQLAMGMVDRTVNNGILQGKSAREIASDVRELIRPDVRGGVSYAAKRLGRTELNNAFHETTLRSAEVQPWTEGMKWHLSGSHPRPDECNRFAEQDSYRMGEGVYPPGRTPSKPHPQCLCWISVIVQSNKDFLDDLFSGKYDSFLAGGGSL